MLQIAWLNAVRETLSDKRHRGRDSTLRARLLTEPDGGLGQCRGGGWAPQEALVPGLELDQDHTLGSGLYNPRAPRVPGARVALTK